MREGQLKDADPDPEVQSEEGEVILEAEEGAGAEVLRIKEIGEGAEVPVGVEDRQKFHLPEKEGEVGRRTEEQSDTDPEADLQGEDIDIVEKIFCSTLFYKSILL